MSTGVVDDLQHAGKYLEEARQLTQNAVVLLDRISPKLTEEAIEAMQMTEDTCEHVRSVSRALESAV